MIIFNWHTLFILILVVDGIHSIGTLPRCPPGWTFNGQSCWMVVDDEFNMNQAQEACQQMDSNLAVPNSKTENDFIFGLFRETWPDAGRSLWLGCKAVLPGNTLTCFESLTGPEGYYTFIPSDEPDKRCVLMAKQKSINHKGGEWIGNDCTRWRYTICERPATRFTTSLQCSAVNLNDAGHNGSYCLLDHTFSVIQTKIPVQCCIACFKNPNCHSFNLSGKMCHLNNATISQVDQDKYLTQAEDYGYFEMKWD